MSDLLIDITNESSTDVDAEPIRRAVAAVLDNAHIDQATVGVAVVDNHQIRHLNREFLNHDYPTDVLSFRLNDDGVALEGDVIVSREMAAQVAVELGDAEWTAERELLLYVVHGTLHLVGYDDKTEPQREQMQQQERVVLARLAILHEAAFFDRGRNKGDPLS
jgi:probable rRNA maturation factor